MSGGVDSSVAAILLKKQGYEVIGIFLKLYSDTKNKLTGECAWVEERKMAQKVAAILNIPLYTLDFENEYKKNVIDPMFKSYALGKTPNPDMLCNAIIKFPLLWKAAQNYNANYIATGHYAIIKKVKNEYTLLAGKDKEKDQSYFLADLSQKDLEHTLFPLGEYKKSDIRKYAKKNNLPNWNKQGTRGICFVGKTDMSQFLRQRIKENKGKIIDPAGNTIGIHQGSAYFTIGQRINATNTINMKKPKESATSRWYVAAKMKNTIIGAPEGHPLLKRRKISIQSLHLINKKQKIPKTLKARIRHRGELHLGTLEKKKNKYEFIFKKPVDAIAEGQYIVLYNKEQVIGTGEIILT